MTDKYEVTERPVWWCKSCDWHTTDEPDRVWASFQHAEATGHVVSSERRIAVAKFKGSKE